MTMRPGRLSSYICCGVCLAAISLGVTRRGESRSTTKTKESVSGMPGVATGTEVSGVAGVNYFYRLATGIKVCGGLSVVDTHAVVNFGDGQIWNGFVTGGPTADLVAANNYANPGQYHVHSRVDVTCRNNNAADTTDSADVDSTVDVFSAPPAVATISCAPLTIKINVQTAACTAQITSAAPNGGTQVRLMSPKPASLANLPISAFVPGGAMKTRSFTVKGSVVGSVAIYATTGEQTGVSSVTLTVN
jgi:hypothetical protein